MARREFSAKTKALAFASQSGVCAHCRLKIVGRAEYDHVVPCGLGGEATIDNCEALCAKCHRAKTDADVSLIAKAARQHRQNIGAHAPKARIPRPPKAPKTARDKLPMPPRRPLYQGGGWIALANSKGTD